MKELFALTIALAFASTAHAQSLERRPHDHTIYTVHGSPDQLAKFQVDVGSQWDGGILIDTDPSGGISRYWAFSNRTASQARQLMLGSMMFGLKLDIDAYEERRFFPAERSELDEIAVKCGFSADPFFITPQRELQFGGVPDSSLQSVDCALKAVAASMTLGSLPMGLVGNEAPSEEVE